MAKVTQSDVISFLKEKVGQLTKELETTRNALSALEGTSNSEAPVARGRKPKTEAKPSAQKRKYTARAGGAKRGRKPKAQAAAPEQATEE